MHLSVDTKSQLPMAIEVTPAHINYGDVAPQLIELVKSCTNSKIDFLVMDGGYDQFKNYESAKNIGAQAIIPLNLRNEKEPTEGIASNGTPRCSMGCEMTYWDANKDKLKFICPHATGKVDCPLGMAACSSYNYGIVVKINVYKDLRRYSNPHHDSKRWKELYFERTSVERCNSRMKSYHTANSQHVLGMLMIIGSLRYEWGIPIADNDTKAINLLVLSVLILITFVIIIVILLTYWADFFLSFFPIIQLY